MTLSITQTCDGCGASRDLGVEALHTGPGVVQSNGWLQVLGSKHLCPKCIKNAIKG